MPARGEDDSILKVNDGPVEATQVESRLLCLFHLVDEINQAGK